MRKIHLSSLAFLGLALIQCTDSPKKFFTYDVNPLRESIVKNKVTSYLEYGFVDGKLEKADSVSFDSKGNTKSRIAKGGWASETFYTYDSLNRLIFETQQSDIFNKIWTQYQLEPDAQAVVKYLRIGNRSDTMGELSYKEILKFDNQLSFILTKTDINLHTNDTTLTKYEYEGSRIKRELEEINGNRRQVTEYIYEGERLAKIRRELVFSSVLQIDYVSKTTGLIDSTTIERPGDATTLYYKYY